jgi:hypothetical protein
MIIAFLHKQNRSIVPNEVNRLPISRAVINMQQTIDWLLAQPKSGDKRTIHCCCTGRLNQ